MVRSATTEQRWVCREIVVHLDERKFRMSTFTTRARTRCVPQLLSVRGLPVKRNSYNEFVRWLKGYKSSTTRFTIGC
jgi:hypothetical protein